MGEWASGSGCEISAPSSIFAPAGVLVPNADDEWPLVAASADDLVRRLEEGGHLTSLPTESAALANAIEVALCAYLIERCSEIDGAEVRRRRVLAGGSKLKRLGTIASDRRELLRRKLASFWAGYIPEVERPPLFE